MSENSLNSPREIFGNTTQKSPQSKRVKQYCFTYNNYTIENIDKLKMCLNRLGKYIFGYEVGENGTPHLQGYINLTTKCCFDKLKKDLDIPQIHIEACKGSQKCNEEYCMKDGNWISNYYEVDEPLEIIMELTPWMLEIETFCKIRANPRVVNWYWEPIGGVGKSSFCKYLCHKYNAIYIDEGKKSDLINIVYNVEKITSKSIIVIDIPRTNGNSVSYKAIEQIKNGMICNTKYETGMKLFNSPHVVIFSNFEPDLEKLSFDRWNVKEIQ